MRIAAGGAESMRFTSVAYHDSTASRSTSPSRRADGGAGDADVMILPITAARDGSTVAAASTRSIAGLVCKCSSPAVTNARCASCRSVIEDTKALYKQYVIPTPQARMPALLRNWTASTAAIGLGTARKSECREVSSDLALEDAGVRQAGL